jgi:OFA family oxalate/formate antiporter-like MFS transporter
MRRNFGLPNKTVVGKLILLGFFAQFFMGPVLVWNIWVLPIESTFNCSRTEASLPFFLVTLFLSFAGVIIGFIVKKLGMYRSLSLSLLLMGIGLTLASYSRSSREIAIFFGLIYGAGVSIGSLSSLTLGSMLPKSRGTVTGIVAVGVTIGMISMIGLHEIINNWRTEFLTVGIFTLIAGIVATLNSRSYYGKYGEEIVSSEDDTQMSIEVKPIQMLGKTSFYLLWISYAFAFPLGLFVSAHLVPLIAKTTTDSVPSATIPIILLALSNMTGRLITGRMIDVIGSFWIYALYMLSILGGLIILLTSAPNGTSQVVLFFIGVIGAGLSYGGFIVSLPLTTRRFFGRDFLFINYGILFTSFGFASLIGSTIAGYIYDLTKSYNIVLLLCIFLSLAGTLFFKLASFLQSYELKVKKS